MTLLEGLSFGVPTIYSNIPENRAVADGLGFPFEVSNVSALVDQLDYVLNHGSEAADMGRRAKTSILKTHSWRTIAEQYNEVYKSLSD